MKIRSDIIRVYKTLHTWVGITSGLLLFIGFFAGALTMFKQPVDAWVSPPQQKLNQVSTAQLDLLVPQVLAQHPEAGRGFSLYLTDDAQVSAPMVWEKPEEGGGRGHHRLDLDADIWQATLNTDNTLIAEPVQPSKLGDLIDMLHRTAGFPDPHWGTYLMGIAGALYFVALISGLIILLPSLVKDFFIVRAGKNRKRFWLDAHNVIGITSLPFHLLIALTVVVFAFHDELYAGLQEVVYQEQPMFGGNAARARGGSGNAPLNAQEKTLAAPSLLIANIHAKAPEYQLTRLRYMGLDGPRAAVRAYIYHPDYLVRGPVTAYLTLDPYSGDVTSDNYMPGKGTPWAETVMHFFALHFGSYGGTPVRWVYFLLGLSGAFLFYSGNLLWVESRRKKQKRDQPQVQQPMNTRLMASATVGIALGSMAGVAAAMLTGKWSIAFNYHNTNALYPQVYYCVFLAYVAWAFWRGAARASVPLLTLCAGLTAAIPVSSLLALLAPLTGINNGLWINTDTASLAVDATAFVLALMLWLAARRTAKRLQSANRDTVWTTADNEQTSPAALTETAAAKG